MRAGKLILQFVARRATVAKRAIMTALRRLSDAPQGSTGWVLTYLLFMMIMGGSMGCIGAALAEAWHYPRLGNMLSGALGASGAFGFEFLARLTAPLQTS